MLAAPSRCKQGNSPIQNNLDQEAVTARKACEKMGLTWPQVHVPADEKKRELWTEAAELAGIHPMFWSDPKAPGLADLLPEAGAVLAGLGMLGVMGYIAWKRK
jgi:hypothetical protein